ncbi:MAG: SDR family oxidoreductase [Calditrichaeota bacterium]|nr:MAG: SDR family oxidoreductase [Calditrichota bacterium]
MKQIKEKTVLITGASSGIGAEFAKLLAEKGAHLILTARSEDKLKELAGTLQEAFSVRARVLPADLSRPEAPARLFQQVKDTGEQVDVVINNAGFGKWGRFDSVDLETYLQMCTLNIDAVVALTHLFLPDMLAKGEGGFINVASTAAFQPVPFFATYSATKAFVLSFSEALSEEYRDQGITVTCLCPGGTATNFHQVSKIDTKKLIGLEPAAKVARVGLDAFLRGQPTVISGFKNYLLANSTRLVPRKTVAKVTAALFRP